jgi:hypothetical protein
LTQSANNTASQSAGQAASNNISSGNNGAVTSSDISDPSKNIIGGDKLGEIFESIMNKIADYLDYIFQPVSLNFSNEVMSNQIHNLSILLWIITICLLVFFISLLINITLYIFSEKLLKYFKNKYLLIYINFNKKVIAFEIIMLSI